LVGKRSLVLLVLLLVGSMCLAAAAESGELILPDFLAGKVPAFVDDFDNLDNWIEEEDFEFNQWAITTKGFLKVQDGVLFRETAGNSGLKLKNLEIVDAAVAVRIRMAKVPESGTVGARIHLRNAEMNWCYGRGINASSYSYELATWHGKGNDKKAIVGPQSPTAQFTEELGWATITAVIQGNKLSYYLNGELIAESDDPESPFAKGGIFLSLTHNMEIDKIAVYTL